MMIRKIVFLLAVLCCTTGLAADYPDDDNSILPVSATAVAVNTPPASTVASTAVPVAVPVQPTSPSATAPLTLVMPTTPTAVGDMITIGIQNLPPAALPKVELWVCPDEGTQLVIGQGLHANDPAFVVFRTKSAGRYKFILVAPDGNGDILSATQVLVVNGPAPPGPPTPPGPGPGPGPDPTPPGPQKIRALIIYDPAQLTKMSEDQRQVIFSGVSGSVRAYLDEHTLADQMKDSQGGLSQMPAYRVWPITVDNAQAGPLWLPLVSAAAGKPSVVVQSGVDIERYDLPASTTDALKLLVPLGGK